METWRLIRSPATGAAANMALDESLLPPSGQGMPTLRLYRFEPAAVSLGYSQPASHLDLEALAGLGWEWVRRPTGGRAVLHRREVTYALALPLSHALAAGGILASYRRLAGALAASLRLLGLEVALEGVRPGAGQSGGAACFLAPSRFELLAGGRKVAGSAQFRRSGWLLQQGSLPLSQDREALQRVLRLGGTGASLETAGSLEEALGRPLEAREVEEALVAGFRQALGVEFRPGGLSPEEEAWARRLLLTKYGRGDWNLRGGSRNSPERPSTGQATGNRGESG